MAKVMISFGSGGHSGEMLMLIKNSQISKKIGQEIKNLVCVISEDDQLINSKLDEQFSDKAERVLLKRARKVGQSYFSSILTTIIGIFHSALIVFDKRPQILLTNGPAISLTLCLAIRFFQVLSFGIFYKCKIVYVESFCRTKSLSLTGKLIYHLNLASEFYVQWHKLHEKYPKAIYSGLLV